MDPSTVTYIWLFAGIALAISELFVPGGVVLFLGAAAVIVAGLRGLGLVEALVPSIAIWAVLSLGLIFSVGAIVRKRLHGERIVSITDEDASVFGQIAEVAEPIQAGEEGGRIRFQGTTWAARTVKGTLPAGSQVRLVDRDNLCWIVEPLNAPLASLPVQAQATASAQPMRERPTDTDTEKS